MTHIPRPLRRLALLGLAVATLTACAGADTPRLETPRATQPGVTSPGVERVGLKPSFRSIELETRQTRIDVPGESVERGAIPPRIAETQPPTRRPRAGSSSPLPDPAVSPAPPRPVPLPLPPSTQSATDAFKRDLLRPEADRMRADDALGRLDPLQQRDLMRRELELRQLGDPLAR
ncbi:hypothetical protein [Azospirillum griseum]|uniref:Beta-barrel assembly machine subunit BamF n=1 Tax=Azospirillum griseum TaxID=2496639 RepID=A0A3S0KXV8_9PROT|nr:hypothetical protein [Azospirillum griseum]RTR19524.1 hypothetical protein EJ903_13615 [Azospirillum griseum]